MERKPHCVLNKKPSGLRFKEHHAARWIGFAEPATPWHCLSELRLLIWLKRWIEKDEKDVKDYFFFIEGACDRFLLSDFPVLAQNRFTWMESRWESSLS